MDGRSTNEKHYYAKYGNEEYYLSLCMFNTDNVVFLQRNSMISLEIEDNIFNPFHSGTLILANDQNVIEKSPTPFVFHGNGRDILDIKIVPIATGDFDKDSKDKENEKYLGLSFRFVIIESTEIVHNNVVCKKLSLVEYSQYMLAENICNIFGLKQAGALVGNYMETNAGNGKPTGEVIKSILYAVYNDGKASDDLFYLDPKTNQQIFEFDGESQITINPYGVMSYQEVLNYVLSFHSFQKSPCVLQFDRFQKKFLLISFKTLFEQNEKYVIESLRFPSTPQNEFGVSENKPEQCPIKWEVFPVTFEESKINQFYIDSPSCKYNVDLAGNSGVLSSSRSFKSMVYNFSTLNSDTFMKTFYDLFVKPFKDQFAKDGGGKLEVFPNFYPNPNKKNNYNTYKGVLAPEMDEKKFLNQKMCSLLYLNNVYQFKLTGKTHRKSLTFIDVVKTAENKNGKFVPTKWDMNVLGRHFITRVRHVFNFDTYYNEVETIKPYRLADGDDEGTSLSEFLTQNA